MSDDRGQPEMKPSQGQELKRTHDGSSDVTRVDQAGDTDDPDKENRDGSLEGTVEKVSTECAT